VLIVLVCSSVMRSLLLPYEVNGWVSLLHNKELIYGGHLIFLG
jgi:hypothetical protein